MRTGIILISVLTYLAGCGTLNHADKKTSIFNMGSLHGHMLARPQYDLKVFISAINQFKPDVIFTEVRPEFLTFYQS